MDKLEKFIREQQEAMDRHEPRERLWEGIAERLDAAESGTTAEQKQSHKQQPYAEQQSRTAAPQQGRVIALRTVFRAAAVFIVLAGAALWLVSPSGPLSGGGQLADGQSGTIVNGIDGGTAKGRHQESNGLMAVHARFPELQEVEAQYHLIVDEKKEILSKNDKLVGEDSETVFAFLDELEKEYTDLEAEIQNLNDPDKLIGAMILNYTQRIEVLERLMQLLDTTPTSNNAEKYENAIVL